MVVEEDLRFSTGFAIESAHDVIEQALAEPEEEEEVLEDEVTDEPSLRDGVAYAHAESQFEAAGFDLDSLTLELLAEDSFSFEGELGASRLPVSGVYDGETEKVSQIFWEFDDGLQSLPSTDLSNLNTAIMAMKAALEAAELEG